MVRLSAWWIVIEMENKEVLETNYPESGHQGTVRCVWTTVSETRKKVIGYAVRTIRRKGSTPAGDVDMLGEYPDPMSVGSRRNPLKNYVWN